MAIDPTKLATSLSRSQRSCLKKVAVNEAVSEAEYISLMSLELINQPLAGNLPPTTELGSSVLRVIAGVASLRSPAQKRPSYLRVVD